MPQMTSKDYLQEAKRALEQAVQAAVDEGREMAFDQIRLIANPGSAAHGAASKPRLAALPSDAKVTKSGRPRKNPWAGMTKEQKAERVRKMLAGRGLTPKS